LRGPPEAQGLKTPPKVGPAPARRAITVLGETIQIDDRQPDKLVAEVAHRIDARRAKTANELRERKQRYYDTLKQGD
jgi:hypothetical protein